MFLAVDGVLAGLLAVADPIKPTSKLAVERLRADGVVIMATGDGLTTARAVARELGIEEVHGEVKPQDKERLAAALQQEGHRVAMAGDGINDAPCPGARRYRHCHGHRHRRGDEQRSSHAGQGRPAGHLARKEPVSGHRAQYAPEPDLCFSL